MQVRLPSSSLISSETCFQITIWITLPVVGFVLSENQEKYIQSIPSFVQACQVFVALVPQARQVNGPGVESWKWSWSMAINTRNFWNSLFRFIQICVYIKICFVRNFSKHIPRYISLSAGGIHWSKFCWNPPGDSIRDLFIPWLVNTWPLKESLNHPTKVTSRMVLGGWTNS